MVKINIVGKIKLKCDIEFKQYNQTVANEFTNYEKTLMADSLNFNAVGTLQFHYLRTYLMWIYFENKEYLCYFMLLYWKKFSTKILLNPEINLKVFEINQIQICFKMVGNENF